MHKKEDGYYRGSSCKYKLITHGDANNETIKKYIENQG